MTLPSSSLLEALAFSAGHLSPAFLPGTTDYELGVDLCTDAILVQPTAASPDSIIEVNGKPVASGAWSEAMALSGLSSILVKVSTAGGRQRTYTIVPASVRQAGALRLKASDAATGAMFGWYLATSGDELAASAIGESSSGANAGAVYMFQRGAAGAWEQETIVKASNAEANDRFGGSLALSGDVLAITAPLEASAAHGVDGDASDNSAPGSGAMYVYRRTDSKWLQEAYIKASNGRAGDYFGKHYISISGDTIAVGADEEDGGSNGVNGDEEDKSVSDSGAAYVFRHKDGAWMQEAYIKASNTDAGDLFGHGLSLSGDTLAVGAYREDSSSRGMNGDQLDNFAPDAGAVYVFQRTGGVWAQEAYIKAPNAEANDDFGHSVSLVGDVLAVSAENESGGPSPPDGDGMNNDVQGSGAVYVYRRVAGQWQIEAYLKASNPGMGDTFGISLALSAGGDVLAVGARYEDSNASGIDGDPTNDLAPDSGAVYLFRREDGVWKQKAYLKAPESAPGIRFGEFVALEGCNVASGAYAEDGCDTGIGSSGFSRDCPSSGAVFLY